ncbi:MAG: hypothetical protein ACI4Q9_02755 [Candidatus Methanomethylophilaceae archaeon]
MSLFSRKTVLIEETSFHMGEVDYTTQSLYDNIRTYPLETKVGKSVYVRVESTNGVDVSVVDASGMNVKFKEHVTSEEVIGPVPVKIKGTMALILGVFAGDRTDVRMSAWME